MLDAADPLLYVAGAGFHTVVAIVFFAYRRSKSGRRRHTMMAIAFTLFAMHNAALAIIGFKHWFSAAEASALAIVLVLSVVGFVNHLRYRQRVRNE